MKNINLEMPSEKVSFFKELPLEERTALSKIIKVYSVKKNELIVKEGQVCRHLVYVCSGLLRQFYYKNGREVTEHFTCEDQIAYCIQSVFRNEPTNLLMEVVEDGELCMIPYKQLLELAALYKGIAKWLLSFFENNLILHQKKADSWRFETAQERYERFLRDFPTVANRAPVNDVASYLLMTPESLSRIRATVRKK